MVAGDQDQSSFNHRMSVDSVNSYNSLTYRNSQQMTAVCTTDPMADKKKKRRNWVSKARVRALETCTSKLARLPCILVPDFDRRSEWTKLETPFLAPVFGHWSLGGELGSCIIRLKRRLV